MCTRHRKPVSEGHPWPKRAPLSQRFCLAGWEVTGVRLHLKPLIRPNGLVKDLL